jgi:hypothetical protein
MESFLGLHICKCTSKDEPKIGNNRVVEGVHVLFCLRLHRDARVKQGAHRTSATN